MPGTDLMERLRLRGWRMTPQRRVVAETLQHEHLHLTAEEAYRRARTLLPEISQATVYNTLNDLVTMGEVRVVALERSPVRYDPNDTPHDHLLCTECGRLYDVEIGGKENLDLPRRQRRGFSVSGTDILVRGTCPECR